MGRVGRIGSQNSNMKLRYLLGGWTTSLKNIRQIGNLPQGSGENKKYLSCHHPGYHIHVNKVKSTLEVRHHVFYKLKQIQSPWSGSNHVIGPLSWDMSLEWSPKKSAPAESCDLATFGLLDEFAPCPGFLFGKHWDARKQKGKWWTVSILLECGKCKRDEEIVVELNIDWKILLKSFVDGDRNKQVGKQLNKYELWQMYCMWGKKSKHTCIMYQIIVL